ncbi:MAG: type II secretion system GspH family protein, partial [Clostridiales Family XIII bacterium]|nr:type II secretion system GspH family protein [Clostridiales Family XIII bacterium]
MGVDRKRICLRDRRGMSLVEMIVAMAIIAVIGGICVSAFTTVLNLETRETDARRASEKAEQQLASGVKATK